jgi:hypothetical protein
LSSVSRTQRSACSGEPTLWICSTTWVGAPPWSGPFSAPIAPATADAMSLWVEVMTRAVKVDAFRPCSAPTMKYASRARAVAASGRSPLSW